MPWYEYTCSSGRQWEMFRPFADSAVPTFCPSGGEARRVYSVPVIHWPQALWTQWGDVHDKSPREMAHDPTVERYDPSGPVAPVKDDPRAGLQRAYDEALSQHGRPEGMT